LRLSTHAISQTERPMTADLREQVLSGGYWLREPAPGAELAIVEGAELVEDGVPNAQVIAELAAGLDLSRVLLELTGTWIKGVTQSDVNELQKFLVQEFGPDVNLANVIPDEILELEAMRVGLGVVGPCSRTAPID
jgi:hypothetical protein